MNALHRWTRAGLCAGAALAVASCSEEPDPMEMPETGGIEATVTAGGAALSGVTVRLFAPGATTALRSAGTGATGVAVFGSLELGGYEVEVVIPAGYELATGQQARRSVTVVANQTETAAFVLEEIVVAPTVGQVRVRVVDGSTGVAGVEVMLFESGGTTPVGTGATAADGRFLFGDLTPGDYDVEITVPDDYELAAGETTSESATVTAGATVDVQFALESTLPAVVEITASGTSFSPSEVTIAPGTTVRWVTPGGGHTVTPDNHSEWTSAALNSAGDVFEHTFDDPGEFDYFCIPHQSLGMTGTVTVQ